MQWTRINFHLVAILLAAQGAFAQTYATHGDEQLAGYIGRGSGAQSGPERIVRALPGGLARLPQVSALPDPEFNITQYVRSPETRVGPQTTMLSISQRFPWFGKLSDQEGIAAKQAAVVREHHRAGQAETVPAGQARLLRTWPTSIARWRSPKKTSSSCATTKRWQKPATRRASVRSKPP